MDATRDMINLDTVLARFTEHWSPKKIADVNDSEVKLVRVNSQFTWQRHDGTDALVLMLDGELTIRSRDRDCPRAERDTTALLLEPRGVVNTGDVGGEVTAEVESLG